MSMNPLHDAFPGTIELPTDVPRTSAEEARDGPGLDRIANIEYTQCYVLIYAYSFLRVQL